MKFSKLWIGLVVLIAVIFLAACQPKSKELNLLCTVTEERCAGVTAEFSAKYNLQVNWVRMSTGEALTRLREERDNPQFDVWWGGPIDSYIVAKNEGLLQAYASPNFVNLLDDRYKDPDNTWAGVYVGSLGFCTNTEWLAQHPGLEPPRSWDDLLKPEFERQILIAHPSTSGTAYTFLSTLLQSRGQEAGWDYMTRFSDQVYQFSKSGSAPAGFVAQGEAAVCVVFSHDIIQQIEDKQASLVLTFPEDGTGYEIGGVAIMAGAQNLDAAQKWVDWSLTAEAQALGPRFGSYSAPTVGGVPLRYPEILEVNLIDYDFVWSAEHKTEFLERFIREIATADNLKQ